jgi:hypothetical protein
MNFAIPRENLSEMVLYIWKIIDYPQIILSDLAYKISFEIFLFSPNEAKKFIENAIKQQYLTKTSDNYVKLSNGLEKQLKTWNQRQKDKILMKIEQLRNQSQERTEFLEENKNHFNVLLKALLDKGTINRAASISDFAFEITHFIPQEGEIVAKVKGSKEVPYSITIDINKKIIKHNCHDFETKRAQNYKFCKHLAKLFLLLKQKDENWANQVLEKITENIEEWTFTT